MGNSAYIIDTANRRVRSVWHKDDSGLFVRDRSVRYAAGDVNVHFAEPIDGLVARYCFDGSLNDSVGGFHLTGFGSIGYGEGISGLAVQFLTGSSTAFVNSSTLSNYFVWNNPYTVSLWVNIPSGIEAFKNSSGELGLSNPSLFVSDLYTSFRRSVYGNTVDLKGDPVSLNVWNHIVISYDGTVMRLYVNHESWSAVHTASTYDSGYTYIKLVGSIYPNGFGLIDQVRIYNRCLEDSEIEMLRSEKGAWKKVNV